MGIWSLPNTLPQAENMFVLDNWMKIVVQQCFMYMLQTFANWFLRHVSALRSGLFAGP